MGIKLIKKPILCNYYLTYRCNAKCAFCDIWERPSPFVCLEDVRENLLALKKLGVRVIDFTGGEPLLHPEVAEFFALAKSFGFITTLTTNALRYEKYAPALAKNVDMLHFSLDAFDADLHDKIRGVKCHAKVMSGITRAKSLGEKPDILFTVTEQNIGEIDKVWSEICLKNGLILILNPVFEYNSVDTLGGLRRESIEYLQKKWLGKKNVYLNNAFLKLRLNGGNRTDSPVCRAGSSVIVISPENKLILPCYHLGIKEIPLENQLEKIWKSQEVQTMIALEGRLPACQSCAVNCYMQPSFAVEINQYWFLALPSTLKYNLMKGTWKKLFS